MLFISARFPFIAKHRFFFSAPGITFSIIFAFPGDAKIALCWTYVGARLGRRLGGVLERSWEVFGRPRCAEDVPRWRQDGPRWRQDGPSRRQDGQDGAKTTPRWCEVFSRWPRCSTCHGARSERASAASDASVALQMFLSFQSFVLNSQSFHFV